GRRSEGRLETDHRADDRERLLEKRLDGESGVGEVDQPTRRPAFDTVAHPPDHARPSAPGKIGRGGRPAQRTAWTEPATSRGEVVRKITSGFSRSAWPSSQSLRKRTTGWPSVSSTWRPTTLRAAFSGSSLPIQRAWERPRRSSFTSTPYS